MMSNPVLASAVRRQFIRQSNLLTCRSSRAFSFSFSGPRHLNDILKKELVENKSSTEVADIWYSYHENKENVHGLVLKGKDAKNLLSRAVSSPFFVQPVFRENGYFMMVSQFQEPSHFLMAYLEDYQMDPAGAQPLLTFSVFDDFSEDKDLTLVRADVLNRGIEDDEGLKVVQNMLDGYIRDDEYLSIDGFNNKPDTFDLDAFISRQKEKWQSEEQIDSN